MSSRHRVDIILGAIDRASPVMSRLGQTMRRGLAGAARIAGAGLLALTAAAGAAVAVTGAMIRKSLQLIDSQAKLGARLGLTTQNIRELTFAAEQSGVEQRTLETGLRNLYRVVGEAAEGFGTGVRAFEQLGLSAEQLRDMTPEEQLYAVADALAGVSNQTDRVALASQLFGGRGVALLNMMQNGSGQLRELTGEFRSFAGEISDVDARGVEMANDAMNRIRHAVRGLWEQLTVELAPVITVVANLALQALGRAKLGTDRVYDSGLGVVELLATLLDNINLLGRIVPGVGAAMARWYMMLIELGRSVVQTFDDMRAALAGMTQAAGMAAQALAARLPRGSFVGMFGRRLAQDLGTAANAGANVIKGSGTDAVIDGIEMRLDLAESFFTELRDMADEALVQDLWGEKLLKGVQQERRRRQHSLEESPLLNPFEEAAAPLIDALDRNTLSTETNTAQASPPAPSLVQSDSLTGVQFRDPITDASMTTAKNTTRIADAARIIGEHVEALRNTTAIMANGIRSGGLGIS